MSNGARGEEIEQVLSMYRIAVGLRRDADSLLCGQYDTIIGRITALLAALGVPPPDDHVES